MVEIIVAIISALASITVVIVQSRNTRTEMRKNQKQILKCQQDMVRSKITDLYYQNKDSKSLQEFERLSLDSLYEGYQAIGGNSYAHDLYEQMRKWEVTREE